MAQLDKPIDVQNIVLLGLPGSGKSHVAAALQQQFGCHLLASTDCQLEGSVLAFNRPGCLEWQDFLNLPIKQGDQQDTQSFWCVIDVRSVLPATGFEWLEEHLSRLLAIADGVVFTFTEAASLDEQAWWGQWVKNHSSNAKKPIVRLMNQLLPVSFSGFASIQMDGLQFDKLNQQEAALYQQSASYQFDVDRVVLDHLLMGLDSSRHNLAMRITRVKAIVRTLEYANLVVIEGTPYRWDTYAAETEQGLGKVEISGIGLDQAWLKQLIDAAKV
ncbi:hypothetical protein THMIRHAM_16430 [Thiomicrorhabdus immobilis]|uniref:ATP-binding protein n=1 Tax=Thiomicrorhabdus immobilis TaxID=2791037 RepID=A0ABM7MEI8_9GAMM|nr:hypothetical protein [Thiomicrorhabdus immobilis]BCN93858.1 hypothetical protein THMIRHAM_16430 [Thiomicrorhabdus immobilis]